MSLASRSCAACVALDSVLSALSSSLRSLAKSTFCVYVALAASLAEHHGASQVLDAVSLSPSDCQLPSLVVFFSLLG